MKRCIFLFLLCFTLLSATVQAADSSYSVTYTISPHADGSAYWTLEYRTLLPGETAVAAFNEEMLNPVTITPDDVQNLMKRSAREASAATSRPMEIQNFTSGHSVQTTPTGTYGVLVYTFTWTGFSRAGESIEIGDVFAMGLYLPRDTTFIIHPPAGYSVADASPAPDQVKGDMIWNGPRSFAAGEPRVVLAAPAFPVTMVAGLLAVIIGGVLLFFWWRSRSSDTLIAPGHYDTVTSLDRLPARPVPVPDPDPDYEEADVPVAEDELLSIEERILRMLSENGGELFQSDITRRLDAPKSTVSSALNILHTRGSIQKIRKGRENLIRRV